MLEISKHLKLLDICRQSYNLSTNADMSNSKYQINSKFFKSVIRAHDSVVPGNIYWSQGELLESSINRSPTSYLANPESERER